MPGTDTQSRPPVQRPRPARTWLHGRLAAWAALLVVWVVWGSTYLAIRVADRTIPPFPMAAARYLIAGAMLYSVTWLGGRGQRRALGSTTRTQRGSSPGWLAQWAGMAVVGTMLLAFGNGGVSYAERTLPSGLTALLVASVPLWMALADWVINGRRIRLGGWLALAIGLAGVAVLAQPPAHGAVFPILIVLGASSIVPTTAIPAHCASQPGEDPRCVRAVEPGARRWRRPPSHVTEYSIAPAIRYLAAAIGNGGMVRSATRIAR